MQTKARPPAAKADRGPAEQTAGQDVTDSVTRDARDGSRRPGLVRESARLSHYLRRTYGELVEHTAADRCDGAHHPGQPHDWWASCTGMALTVQQRASAAGGGRRG